jgi:hypothetical protein
MASGVEIAGLALAVLPLVIEAAKLYGQGVGSIKNVVIAERRDEKLQGFYEDFYWETFFLDRTLRKIVNDLPLLCKDCKNSLFSDKSLNSWKENEEVVRALLIYFGGEQDVDAFTLVFSKVLGLIDNLTKDKTTKLTPSEKARFIGIFDGNEYR